MWARRDSGLSPARFLHELHWQPQGCRRLSLLIPILILIQSVGSVAQTVTPSTTSTITVTPSLSPTGTPFVLPTADVYCIRFRPPP